jgi:DNA invertase Pin-like site-specific DNA recombinase
MAKRKYTQSEPQSNIHDLNSYLPTHRPVAVYYRQSTDAQIGNVATAIQTVDMKDYLIQRGWSADLIMMIDMDGGISGTTKIDERPGMSLLFDMITNREIGAVACQDEDRLFRDFTQIQVNIFVEACREAKVLVITPTMVYDFAHESMGSFHARQFRFKSEMSAEYISSYIRGRLHRAKRRVMMEGRWAGGSVPLGYMVDTRKKLPDGSENPDWKRYVPYEPFAQIINEYFKLFLERNGNVKGTVRHIIEHGPFFPDVAHTPAPDGFRFVGPYTFKNYGKGFCPGNVGLANILTNAAYLGHWTVNGCVVRWNNHTAIVPTDLFMKAFNYVSEYTLEGKPNPSYRPFQENARPTLEEKRSVERPLLSGMIFTKTEHGWQKARSCFVGKGNHYAYSIYTPYPVEKIVWWRKAEFIDEPIVKLFQKKLKATFDDKTWHESLDDFEKEQLQVRLSRINQIKALERTMENLITSLETIDTPAMITKIEARYKAAEEEHKRLSSIVVDTEDELATLQAIKELRATYSGALSDWQGMSRDEKRSALHAFIGRIVIQHQEPDTLEVTVEWRDKKVSRFELAWGSQDRKGWAKSEVELLLRMVDDKASQIEICAAFPERTWQKIYKKYSKERGVGLLITPKPIQHNETYHDYLARVGEDKLPVIQTMGEFWTDEETTLLSQMVNNGITRIDLAEAFPHRNWNAIRAKIREAIGNGVSIKGYGTIRQDETIHQYRLRVEKGQTPEQGLEEETEVPEIYPETPVLEFDIGRNQ